MLFDAEAVEEQMVGGNVHVFVFGEIAQSDSAGPFLEDEGDMVAVAPVIPVPRASVREHHGCGFEAVNSQRAHAGLVLGVDRTVAIGIAEGDSVDFRLGI